MSKYSLQVVLQPVIDDGPATVLVEELHDDLYAARTRGKYIIAHFTESTQQRCIFYVIPVVDDYELHF